MAAAGFKSGGVCILLAGATEEPAMCRLIRMATCAEGFPLPRRNSVVISAGLRELASNLLYFTATMRLIRLCKIFLVFSVGFFLFLVVLNNLTDYGSNYAFVENVLGMTTVFEDNQLMWRAIESPVIHTAFYWSIILWEAVAMALIGWGGVRLCRALGDGKWEFQSAKQLALAGLTLSLLQWFVAFITVGGEWFAMWQSEVWNGQDAAFRMFTCIGIVLLFLYLPEFGEPEGAPA